MSSAEQLFQQALQLHASGDLVQAETVYRAVIAVHKHPGALSNLGQILRSRGELGQSLELQQRACEHANATAEMHFNLGNAQRQAKQLPGALTSYRQAVLLKPEFALAHCALGIVVQHQEGASKAHKHYQQAIELDKGLWRAWFGRAETSLQIGPANNAISDLQCAAQLAPQQLSVWRLLAQTLSAQTDLAGQNDQSLIQACQRWAALDQTVTQPLIEIAAREWAFKNHEASINALREAVKRAPDDFNLLSFLSLRLAEVHHVGEADGYCQQALSIKPDDMTMLAHAGKLQMLRGNVQNAVERFGELYARDPEGAYGGRNWLFASLYDETLSAQTITNRHIQVAKGWAQTTDPSSIDMGGGVPRRIGYLTPDLTGDHPVAQFFEPILSNHDHQRFEIFIYSATDKVDNTTHRCQQLTLHWHDVQSLDDQKLAELMRTHQLDVLIDLAGHTKGSRISVFGYRPAPVQICWLGYPYTTGHPQCDFLLVDKIVCPPGQAGLYSESLLYLPDCVFCQPKLDEALINSGPAHDKPITFGNFGAFQKVTPKTFRLWIEVLQAIPESRLMLKNGSFADGNLREQFAKRLIKAGISSNRFELQQPSPFAHMMEEYNSVDVVLDTLAYNGGTTAFHALWMGVPTLTQPGNKFCSRMGASVMHAVAGQGWIVSSKNAYIKQAQWAAANLTELRTQRNSWRGILQSGPLGNHARFVSKLEQAVCSGWQRLINMS